MFSRKRKTVNLNTEAIDLKYTQAIAAKTLMRMRLQAGFVTPDRNIVIRTWPYEGMGAGAPATRERYLLPRGAKSSPPVRLRNILAQEEAPQQTRFRAAVAAVAMGTVVAPKVCKVKLCKTGMSRIACKEEVSPIALADYSVAQSRDGDNDNDELGLKQSLLKRARLAGTKRALRTVVAQSRALVFVMGSTTPFFKETFQDLRWVISDRVVNGSPVWAAEGGRWFMYCSVDIKMMISNESECAAGSSMGHMYNMEKTADAVAPTELASDKWVSGASATLATQYASAERLLLHDAQGRAITGWVSVPEMRQRPPTR
jgi:hypothetical protein